MDEQLLKKEFKSLQEVFEALSPAERGHCERTGEYMRVIFAQACSAELYPEDPKATVRLKEEYAELAEDIGRLHDIGKAMVPPAYRVMQESFTPEELALFRRHPQDSAELAEKLLGAEKKYKYNELKFLSSAIASHHESWDGTGYPEGVSGISSDLLGRMLAAADELDHQASSIRSEHPFEEAIDIIDALAGSKLDPAIIRVIKAAKPKLKKVFISHIAQSRAIPVTKTIIKRSAGRPFGLEYRPVCRRKDGSTAAYQAAMSFKGKKENLEYKNVEYLVDRDKLQNELAAYFLLEVCDTVNRFETCSVPFEWISVTLPGGWLKKSTAWRDAEAAIKNTEIRPEKLLIEIDGETLAGRTRAVTDNLARLKRLGCGIIYTGVDPREIDPKEDFCTALVISPEQEELLDEQDFAEALSSLKNRGVTLIADSIDRQRRQGTLTRLGVMHRCGALTGGFENEDEIVKRELASQETA